ncbi:MAG: hypothetical protein ACLFTK_16565 [Anaerolineales bacterium]
MSERFARLARWYGYLALIGFNLGLLLVCLNLALAAYGALNPAALPTPAPPNEQNLTIRHDSGGWQLLGNADWDALRAVHASLSPADMVWMLIEYNNVMACDETLGWRVPPYAGRFHTQHPAGFRAGDDQAPWPPPADAVTIFVFGGSTTYGTHLPGAATIPSHLQRDLRATFATDRIVVYNFGAPAYISTQERLKLAELLAAGHVPDIAIFIDGLNDSNFATRTLADIQRPCNATARTLRETLNCDWGEWCWPLQRAWGAAWATEDDAPSAFAVNPPLAEVGPLDDPALAAAVVARWLDNRAGIEALAAKYGLRTLYVLQPTPGFAYDLDHHLWLEGPQPTVEDLGTWGRTRYTYPLWEVRAEGAEWAHNFSNLARIAQDYEQNIWVDQIHYTDAFSAQIAAFIRLELDTRGWVAEALR